MSIDDWLSASNWFDELIQRAKAIESQMELDIWKRYRDCGLLLLEVANKHSLEGKGFRKRFMEAMNIKSSQTVNTMLQLGRMSEGQMLDTIKQYNSIFRFAHKLPITVDVQQYRKEHSKPVREFECEEGCTTFPHCCVLCPSFKKKVINK